MNRKRIRRTAVITISMGVFLIGACGLWIQSRQRQYVLSRELIAALMKSDSQAALALVNAGADPNTPDVLLPPPTLERLWNYLLHRAAPRANENPTAFHIACGAAWSTGDENADGSVSTAPQLVEAMVKHGANLSAKDPAGSTPLMYAIHNDQPKIVALLLDAGADANDRDRKSDMPLIAACDADPDIVRMLLEHGADVNTRNRGGETPLIRLVPYTDANAVRLLLEHKADVNATDVNGNTPLMRAVTIPATPPETIRILIEHGAGVNAVDYYGNTPLTLAASNRDTALDTVRLLLDRGADPNARTRSGLNALQIAMQQKRFDVVALLQQAGVKR